MGHLRHWVARLMRMVAPGSVTRIVVTRHEPGLLR